jgi:hypothetical protein
VKLIEKKAKGEVKPDLQEVPIAKLREKSRQEFLL